MHASRLAVCGLAIAAPVLLCAQSSGPVASASIEVGRKIVPAVLVSVTNRYQRPIVAVEISAASVTAGFRFSEHRSGAAPVPNATILNGETRTLTVRVDQPSSRGLVTSVRFEDGRTEGGDRPLTSIAVTSTTGTATNIMAVLHNRRAAPIRAWRIQEYEIKRGLTVARGGQASSLCEGTANALIAGGATREIMWSGAENYETAVLPTLTLEAVLWEDGVTEGTAAAIEELQRLRARSRCGRVVVN